MVIDSGIFIEHLRAKDKLKTTLYFITGASDDLFISSVTLYELYIGATSKEKENDVYALTSSLKILSFSDDVALMASKIYHQLKKDNKIIEFRDIFIAATCLVNKQPLATLNKKHFNRVDGLKIL